MSHCWFPVKNELQRNSFAQVSKLEASLVDLDSFHTTPEEFEDGGFALETHQMFFVHTTLEGFKTQQSLLILDLCLKRTPSGRSRDDIDVIVFKKLRCKKIFSVHTKTKSPRF